VAILQGLNEEQESYLRAQELHKNYE